MVHASTAHAQGPVPITLETRADPIVAHSGIGSLVAMEGDHVAVVGTNGSPFLPGTAYIFNRHTGAQVSRFDPTSIGSLRPFNGIDIESDIAVVASQNSDIVGEIPGTIWTFDVATGQQRHTLHEPPFAQESITSFGRDVSMSGGVILTADPLQGEHGLGYLFDAASGTFLRTLGLTTARGPGSWLGQTLEIEGSLAALSESPYDALGNNSHGVVLFDVETGVESGRLVVEGDYRIDSIGITDDYLVLGRPRMPHPDDVIPEDSFGGWTGVIEIYDRESLELVNSIYHPLANDDTEFGRRIEVDGDYLLTSLDLNSQVWLYKLSTGEHVGEVVHPFSHGMAGFDLQDDVIFAGSPGTDYFDEKGDFVVNPGAVYRYNFTPTPPRVAGDYDGNGIVDEDDYARWHSSFGSSTELAADGNDNGVVDLADYTVWRDRVPLPVANSVPEPGAAFLLVGVLVSIRASRPRTSR
ncbi:MAG: hypothetical protein AAFV43_01415 [Planctomycetota bacterium]